MNGVLDMSLVIQQRAMLSLRDVVKTYVKWATDTQRLADQAKFISYGPARKSSAPLVLTVSEKSKPVHSGSEN